MKKKCSFFNRKYMDVSKNRGTPKSSSLIGFSLILINHLFWGTPIFGNTHMNLQYGQPPIATLVLWSQIPMDFGHLEGVPQPRVLVLVRGRKRTINSWVFKDTYPHPSWGPILQGGGRILGGSGYLVSG